MAFDHADLTAHVFAPSRQAYTQRDTMLYALGLGLGADPLDRCELRFVYEKDLLALPTLGVVLAHPGFWAGDPALGIDWKKMLQVGQGLTVHRPLAPEGVVVARSRIADVIDRGAEKGALLYYERDVLDETSGALLATVRQTLLCRGNGGFGGPARAIPETPAPPQRPADHVVTQTILPQAALIYRLSGDVNPLHADPDVAAAAGFPQPILHGLATFGMAAYALLREVCSSDPAGFRALDARFTAPVFPGETIRTELWRDGGTVSLRTTAVERGKVVLDNGRAQIDG